MHFGLILDVFIQVSNESQKVFLNLFIDATAGHFFCLLNS